MSNPHQLRAGGSGPVFDGEAGDVLTMQASGEAKFAPPSGGGGSIEPLTVEFWVDQGRAGSTQDGSIANPFLAIQNGIDAIEASLAGTGSLLVAEGDYSAEELEVPLPITIVGTTKQVIVAKLGNAGVRANPVKLVNVLVAGESWLVGGLYPTRVEGGGLLGPVDMTGEPRLEGLNAVFGTVTCIDVLGQLSFRSCSVAGVIGTEGGFHADQLECWDTTIGGAVDVENAFLHLSEVGGGLTAHRATLEQSTVKEGLTVANTLIADTFSLLQARWNVVAANPLPLLTTVTDHRNGFAILAVPAIEQGSFAEINMGAPGLGAREGDTIAFSLATDGDTPRLDNIGIANAWINANGSCTIRLFGTTAGGSQLFNFALFPCTP